MCLRRMNGDTRERMLVGCKFMLEIYKVATGTLLSVFVVHNCPDDPAKECSIVDSFTSTTTFSKVTLVANTLTLTAVCVLYVVELARENWMISTLDINPDYPDTYLDDVAPPPVLARIRKWNHWYWKTALTAGVLAVGNISISTVFLVQNFRGTSTATACASFALLVLMKLYGSFTRARRDNAEQRARSAFMTEDRSFNVLDPDYAQDHGITLSAPPLDP